jgi:hypothetical protein
MDSPLSAYQRIRCTTQRDMFSSFRLKVVRLSRIWYLTNEKCSLASNSTSSYKRIKYTTPREMFSSYGPTVVRLSQNMIYDQREMFSSIQLNVLLWKNTIYVRLREICPLASVSKLSAFQRIRCTTPREMFSSIRLNVLWSKNKIYYPARNVL